MVVGAEASPQGGALGWHSRVRAWREPAGPHPAAQEAACPELGRRGRRRQQEKYVRRVADDVNTADSGATQQFTELPI